MSHGNQPSYFTKINKQKAREQLVKVWRDLTSLHSIPTEKNYWTLCNKQPDCPGSEIVDLVNLGLLKKSQFCGVDYDLNDEGIQEQNATVHPDAHWFRGDFVEVIDSNYEMFKPSLVYYDSTMTGQTKYSQQYMAQILNLCPSETIVAANIMMTSGYQNKIFSPDTFILKFGKLIIDPQDWKLHKNYCFEYQSSQARMYTLFLERK